MLKKIIISIILLFGLLNFSNSLGWEFFGHDIKNIYESVEKEGLKKGIEKVKNTVGGIETEQSFSEYVQSLVIYFLSFLSLIALVYIIYAGIMIMFSGSDEEKMKNQKKTIISVILGIVVIWLAWSIVITIFKWLNTEDTSSGGGTISQQAVK